MNPHSACSGRLLGHKSAVHKSRGFIARGHATLLAAIAILSALVLPRPLQARTLHVPAQYHFIEDAVDQAQPNDTVLVSPGSYPLLRQINLDQPGVVLVSQF